MRNKILLVIVLILATIYYKKGSIHNEDTSFFNNSNEKQIIIKNTKNEDVLAMKVEEYLVGVLAGEMPASFNEEALKAQAIASRTYAYYKIQTSTNTYDITNDTTSQVHLSEEQMHDKWKDDYNKYLIKIKSAIHETTNEVLTYNGKIISAYYFAMSNGYTENSANVFNEVKEYLISVPSNEDETNKNFEVTKIIDKDTFCQCLKIACNTITITGVIKNNSNHIDTIIINDSSFSGIELRKLLNLRSTDFDIEVSDSDVYITTRGYGHGVGMSQYGANNMANNGYSYRQILAHYYTNTKIENINSII